MVGIYKITNKINDHSYIGASKDIQKRWNTHKKRAFQIVNNKEYNKTLYQAFRKYGIENFNFEILEETSEKDLFDKEIFYIQKFNTFQNGYNETIGGEGCIGDSNYGENHPLAKLTEKDIYYIRDCYNSHKDPNEIFEQFSQKIGLNGFKKIWNGYTWTKTHMDVYTDKNKIFYNSKKQSRPGEKNGRTKLSNQDVLDIRLRKKNGESQNSVYDDYKNFVTKGSFKNIWYYQNWKNIIV